LRLNKPFHPHPRPRARVALGRFSVRVPQSRSLRIALGIALVIGGMFGFLPILGFWMIPLGLLVLSIDFHPVRRFRRRITVRWGRRNAKSKPNGQ
jgi:purine-cytosine permease-like protein